jgi:hypothetical protein
LLENLFNYYQLIGILKNERRLLKVKTLFSETETELYTVELKTRGEMYK